MKNTRKFAAFVASFLAVACMSVPMATSFSADAASITITNAGDTAHTFEVYQVFVGDLSDGKLSNLKWGSGVASYDGSSVTEGDAVSDDVINALTALNTDGVQGSEIAKLFTLSSTKACDDVTSTGGTATISDLSDGYYIVKDVTNLDDKHDANSAYIIQVAGEANLAIKNALPTVDKQVCDEVDDAEKGAVDGWGESADHAINESFQFKLIATIPADADYAAYESYKVVFNDTMSQGVTFESIADVKVAGNQIESSGYKCTAISGQKGGDWTLTIDDIKDSLPTSGDAITVEVIYNAHLNEDATLHNESDTAGDTNENTVSLSYSNNPDATGTGTNEMGKTPEDNVWVFTYKVDNTKYQNEISEENLLAGAGFTLYNNDRAVKFSWNETKEVYVVDDNGSVTEMTSKDNGKFNIIGLDAGTYTLKETSTPEGYNTCADVEIVISAKHNENANEISADLDLTGSKNMNNQIINKAGSELPSTGGIGTTIFYVAGGALVVGAGVLLVSKKRMSNK